MTKGELAMLIYGGGSIKFGSFRLKMHEKFPDAPLSPIYINLRTPPNGPLKSEFVKTIGSSLYRWSLANGPYNYNCVVGLPKAGEPLAEAFVKHFKTVRGRSIPLLRLEKYEDERGRQILPIVHGEYQPGWRVLMIDDLITKAETKLEAARALRSNRLVVKDCLVVVDREQGGSEQLAQVGIRLYAIFTLSWLLDFYQENGLITTADMKRVINYLREVRII